MMMTNRLKGNQCFSSQAVRQSDEQNWRSALNVFVRRVRSERTFWCNLGKRWLGQLVGGAADDLTRDDDSGVGCFRGATEYQAACKQSELSQSSRTDCRTAIRAARKSRPGWKCSCRICQFGIPLSRRAVCSSQIPICLRS
jgi:hypothetical protein